MHFAIWTFSFELIRFASSYMKGAKEGDVVIIDAKTIRAGKKIAFLECDLLHKKDGSIIARGTQTKFIGGSG